MEIKLTVTISDIEGWGPNWNDSVECIEQMAQVRQEVRRGIVQFCGIPSSDIDIESELIK